MEIVNCKKCGSRLYTDFELDIYSIDDDATQCVGGTAHHTVDTLFCTNCITQYYLCPTCTTVHENDYNGKLEKIDNLTYLQIVGIPSCDNERMRIYDPDIVEYEYDEVNECMKNNSSIPKFAEVIYDACDNSNSGMYDIRSWNLCEWNTTYAPTSPNRKANKHILLTGPDGGFFYILYCKSCDGYFMDTDK